ALHTVIIFLLLALGLAMPLGPIYFVGLLAVALLLVYEHRLVGPDDLSKVNVAFFQVNILISIGLLVVTIIDLAV
ncbi:MAG: 4-hydroxybenzoate octaprenyltransferase, partial [bacterium]